MRDRLPAPGKENRVKITLDDGRTVEGVLSYADDAAQEGSAYTKGNVLPDDVCDTLGIDRVQSEPKDAFAELGARVTPMGAYGSDLYLYITGQHPFLNAGPYNDYYKYKMMNDHRHVARTISLTGNAQEITVYDSKELDERM